MTAVFALLGCLVVVMHGMSRFAAMLEAREASAGPPSAGIPEDADLTVAIAAAIHAHRRRGRETGSR